MKSTIPQKSIFVVIFSLLFLIVTNSHLTADKLLSNDAVLLDSKTYLPIVTHNYPQLRIDDYLSRCPTAAEIASVDAALSIQFEDDPSAPTLVCTVAEGSQNLTQLQKNTYNTILLMRELEFDQPLPWTPKQLYQWFIDAVDGIRFRGNIPYSFCCEPDKIINIRVADNFGAIHDERWGNFGDSGTNGGMYVFMGLLIHEARHGEGNYPHTCSFSKDNTIAEMGAWGVHYYFFKWLAYHSDPCFVAPGDFYTTFYLENAAQRAHNMLIAPDGVFCQEPEPVLPPPPVTACTAQIGTKGLTGRVTFNGVPVSDLRLQVMRNNNGILEDVADIYTDQYGVYSYTEAPALLPNQRYYISFYNYLNGNNPDWLYTWATLGLNSYTQGVEVKMGDFDIANINILAPSAGETVYLPRTLSWDMRTSLPKDEGYRVRIVGVGKTAYFSGSLGYVGSLTLQEGDLADNHFSGENSYWAVGIYRDDGAGGETALRPIIFRR